MTRITVSLLVAFASVVFAAQGSDRAPLLKRQYRDGDSWVYRMDGVNNGAKYEARIAGAVRKRPDGRLFDELTWVDAPDLRQAITLDGDGGPFVPADVAAGIAKAPGLVGPFTDLLTFYADLYLAMHAGHLQAVGDRFTVPGPMTGSWADGQHVLVGEDHVDFNLELTALDANAETATLVVKHVPPVAPKIRFPAEWMRTPVASTPNNFVQIRKTSNGYVASVGKETFDVTLKVRIADGMLLSGAMENPVETVDRNCADAALTDCGEARPGHTFRHVEIALERYVGSSMAPTDR